MEKERAGGTCLNWGCIPTKALLRNAELYHTMTHRAAEFGFKIDGLSYDWSKIIGRSRDVSDKNAAGIEFLFKKNKIDYIRGEASIDKPRQGEGESRRRQGGDAHRAEDPHRHRLRAARRLPGFPFNGKTVIGVEGGDDPRAAAEEHDHHRRRRHRHRVRLFLQRLRHQGDRGGNAAEPAARGGHRGLARRWRRSFTKQGIKFLTNTKDDQDRERRDKGVKITVQDAKGAEQMLEADVCLVAIGVPPLLPGGSQKIELTERGYIKTNDRYETSVPGVLRRGRHHRAAVAGARGELRGHPGRGRDVHDGHKPKKVDELPRLHLLPAAGRQRRPHRARGEGKGAQVQGRQIPLHGQRQGPRRSARSKAS